MKKLLAVMVGAVILMGGASLSRADWGYYGHHHRWHHGWGVAFPYYSVAPVYCAPPSGLFAARRLCAERCVFGAGDLPVSGLPPPSRLRLRSGLCLVGAQDIQTVANRTTSQKRSCQRFNEAEDA
jgi:hypothetical protein